MSVAAPAGGADGDGFRIGVAPAVQIDGERQAPGSDVAGHHLVRPGS